MRKKPKVAAGHTFCSPRVMARIHHRSLTTLTLLTTGFLSGCTFDGGGIDDVGVGGVGGYPVGAGGGYEPGTGGSATTTGGASGTGGAFGCDGPVPPVTVLCAGNYYESSAAGRALGILNSVPGPYACGEPDYGTGGWIGVGGSSTGGAAAGGGGWGGAVEEEIPFEDEGTGGVGVGAAGGCAGDDCGTGGYPAAGGGPATGGAGGGSGSGWCDGLDWDDSIAGISFGAGACQKSELALPLVFDEPYGFYHLRVYAGSVACERGVLLTEVAGYGTGASVSLPVNAPGEGFVSLELTSDGYSFTEMTFGLTPLGAVGELGSE